MLTPWADMGNPSMDFEVMLEGALRKDCGLSFPVKWGLVTSPELPASDCIYFHYLLKRFEVVCRTVP